MKGIKTNARVYVELYLGHINIARVLRLRIRIQTGGKTCIVQQSVWDSVSVSVSVGGNKPSDASPLPCGQTDTCENITLPQTSFTGGKNINSPIILGGCAALLMNKNNFTLM